VTDVLFTVAVAPVATSAVALTIVGVWYLIPLRRPVRRLAGSPADERILSSLV
jgi:hypothetical protein